MLTKIRENENGTVFHSDFVPAGLFNFYILRRRTFSDGTANWNICCEHRNDPNQFMILSSLRGTKEDAVLELKTILEEKQTKETKNVPSTGTMKETSVDTMEIGNLIFGNSRGHYQIPRTDFQDMFLDFLDKNGFDEYGYHENNTVPFETEKFSVRPYYWGEDENIAALPNFVYKPKNIEISWYKYPLRDAYCSHNLTIDEFRTMLNDCTSSIEK